MRARLCGLVVAIGFVLVSGGPPATVLAHPDNVVVDWNQAMLAAFATANVPPPNANRLGATVAASVFDAVNGIEGRYRQIHVPAAAAADASPKAAAASAAHSALVALFPAQQASLDAAFAASLQPMSDGEDAQSIADGVAWGATVAGNIVAWRAGDGFSAPPPTYVFSTAAGQWQPTPGGSGAPKFRTLATTTPWAMTSPSEFRPAGPPGLTSARYTQDFNEVMAFGSLHSTVRTSDETQTAAFWQLDTPVGIWDRVADSLLLENHENLLQSARVLALTDISIADAVIAVFDAKNFYNSWRPVTAIRATVDPTWLPLLTTPYFQEYPSAHSGTSAAAAAVLASLFGDGTSFTVTSAGLPGVTRDFTSFHDAVAQVTNARVWAGFHFRFSCDDASSMGAQIAANTKATLMQPAGD